MGDVDVSSSIGKGGDGLQPFHGRVIPPTVNGPKMAKRGKSKVPREAGGAHVRPSPPSSSESSSSATWARSASRNKGVRLVNRRRNARFFVRKRAGDAEAIAFPLGMSIAAVAAQVLERTDETGNAISTDHLCKLKTTNQLSERCRGYWICTSAVRESLTNVFGDKFESFATNFEKSFVSTLNTLRLIKSSSVKHEGSHLSQLNLPNGGSNLALVMCSDKDKPSLRTSSNSNGEAETTFPPAGSEMQERKAESTLPSLLQDQSISAEEIQVSRRTSSMIQEISLHGEMRRELSHGSANITSYYQPMLSTMENSIVEQARANDLKTVEIGLAMKKLQLKETQLALASQSNLIERCKISLGFSKASFKSDKFKNQLEETRYGELLRTCIDCQVAGLLIMTSSLIYGAYVYSYKRISEATSTCTPPSESKSWWVPSSMSAFNSGLHTLRCQAQVMSRMLFGFCMILVMAYLLIQRSASPRHTMPVTFILLLLGIGCGFAGKFCIDTLGGSGSHWLMCWEILCTIHLFANVFPPILFHMLYGPIKVSQGANNNAILFPYWLRRVVFYLALLVVMPLISGLTPFASIVEWKEHFSSLMWNVFLVDGDNEY